MSCVTLIYEVWIHVKVTAHRLNEDNICTESLTMSFVSDSVGMVTRDKSKVSVQNAFIVVHLYRPMRRYISFFLEIVIHK